MRAFSCIPSSSFYFRPYCFQTNWTNTKGSEITLSPEKDSIFGILALTFLVDVWDALLQGNEYTPSLGVEYPVRTIAYLVLCLPAIFINNQRFPGGLFGTLTALSGFVDPPALSRVSLRIRRGSFASTLMDRREVPFADE